MERRAKVRLISWISFYLLIIAIALSALLPSPVSARYCQKSQKCYFGDMPNLEKSKEVRMVKLRCLIIFQCRGCDGRFKRII